MISSIRQTHRRFRSIRKPHGHGYGAGSRNKGPPLYVGTRLRLDPSVFEPHIPLGARLKWAREYLGLHQKDLARRWKRDPMTILGWEKWGRVPANPKDLRRIERLIAQAQGKLDARLASPPTLIRKAKY